MADKVKVKTSAELDEELDDMVDKMVKKNKDYKYTGGLSEENWQQVSYWNKRSREMMNRNRTLKAHDLKTNPVC
jgi:hypothetical protein